MLGTAVAVVAAAASCRVAFAGDALWALAERAGPAPSRPMTAVTPTAPLTRRRLRAEMDDICPLWCYVWLQAQPTKRPSPDGASSPALDECSRSNPKRGGLGLTPRCDIVRCFGLVRRAPGPFLPARHQHRTCLLDRQLPRRAGHHQLVVHGHPGSTVDAELSLISDIDPHRQRLIGRRGMAIGVGDIRGGIRPPGRLSRRGAAVSPVPDVALGVMCTSTTNPMIVRVLSMLEALV